MMGIVEFIQAGYPYLVASAALVLAVVAGGHAILYRRDARTSIAWVGLIWLVPLLGSLLYFAFGINRVARRARTIRPTHHYLATGGRLSPEGVTALLGTRYLEPMVRLMDRVVELPLLGGNRVELLEGGDRAFSTMLEAIARAQHTVTLTSFIFDSDRAGHRFVDALGAAAARGVDVRVIVDGVGVRYSHPPITTLLRRAGVRAEVFLRPLIPWRFPYMNLRCHRKSMIVDGALGFTGGMNIREGAMRALEPPPSHPICDVHACIEGPVVGELQRVFLDDWAFVTGEHVEGEAWLPAPESRGQVAARAIPDGPDENLDELRMTLLGVLSLARERVRVVTPYFIPDPALITALSVAAMRGVAVEIVLPKKNNLRLVQWASMATLWQVLERGCRVFLSPPPFDHTKLMSVDGVWSLIGSGNWDPRSLRLNFELNVECYDRPLAKEVERIAGERIAASREITLAAVNGRSLPIRLRDGVARLGSPFL